MPPRSHIRPSLPQSLLDAINGENGSTHRPKRMQQLSRREARKQTREGRKQRKASASSRPTHHVDRRVEIDHAESPRRKRVKLESAQSAIGGPSSTPSTAKNPRLDEPSGAKLARRKTALERMAERSAVPKARKMTSLDAVLRTAQEEEEEAYIAHLERKLGWVKGGKRTANYGRGEEEDELDSLLMDLDGFSTSAPSHQDESEGSDVDAEYQQHEASDYDEHDEDEDMGEELQPEQGHEGDLGTNGDEWHGFAGSEGIQVCTDISDDDKREPKTSSEEKATAPSAVPASKYVPPHLRQRAESGTKQLSESQLRLTRQLKGLLNRMSEQNMSSILDGIEEVYRNNRRHDVTETLTSLVIDGICSHSMLLDQYVVLHAAFISAIHKLVGVEFAAFFVQHVISSYDTHFATLTNSDQIESPTPVSTDTIETNEPAGKECSNLVVLLSEMYNFQIISCVLMYDVIRTLLNGDLTEFKVELLLKVAKNSGQQFRQDDPTALKNIIQIVNTKLPQDMSTLSSRTRFMVETLSNLKNNKVKKNSAQTAGNEAVERMKKFLTGLTKKRHVMSHEPLRVSLDDLRSADTKGKWWLVGAAWEGDPLLEHQQATENEKSSVAVPDGSSEIVLSKLAKKQGMNTDIRRGIFVVLMSSEDYVDACDRLSQLRLMEVQQREIIRVILHCCGNEKQYNPYYALVGQQLCRLSHSHKVTLQFCLWDFLRDLGETNVGGAEILKSLSIEGDQSSFNVKSISSTRMRNVARAFGWWIAKDCCTLAILKPVDFTILKPQTRTFLKEMFIHAMANTQLATPLLNSDLPSTKNKGPLEDVFQKGSKIQTLALGLLYFFPETFKGEEGFLKWASQVALQTLRTGTDIVH